MSVDTNFLEMIEKMERDLENLKEQVIQEQTNEEQEKRTPFRVSFDKVFLFEEDLDYPEESMDAAAERIQVLSSVLEGAFGWDSMMNAFGITPNSFQTWGRMHQFFDVVSEMISHGDLQELENYLKEFSGN